jgi:hypothetical protein
MWTTANFDAAVYRELNDVVGSCGHFLTSDELWSLKNRPAQEMQL